MKRKDQKISEDDTMQPEYKFDYSKAVWGKHARRLIDEESNTVVIQPDVFKFFPDSESVNNALRSLIEISKRAGATKSRRKRRAAAGVAKTVKT
jgi:hypothetical protein